MHEKFEYSIVQYKFTKNPNFNHRRYEPKSARKVKKPMHEEANRYMR